jgi:hypothetical protein
VLDGAAQAVSQDAMLAGATECLAKPVSIKRYLPPILQALRFAEAEREAFLRTLATYPGVINKLSRRHSLFQSLGACDWLHHAAFAPNWAPQPESALSCAAMEA